MPAPGEPWVARFQGKGSGELQDRSSRPHRLHRPIPAAIVERIAALRRRRWTGQRIAAGVGVSPATVSRVLKRLGLNKLKALKPAAPPRRYERARPGELIHIDIKELGKFSRTGHHITGERTRQSSTCGLGVSVERVMTDNGPCYKSFAFKDACRDFGLGHIRTKPYTPKTNGKAERFIQTALGE